jgi:hypothetical protein
MLLRTVMVAHATLDAIDTAMEADDGARFRVLQGELFPKAADAYRGEDGGHRSHLGASILGRDCAREVWYSFRWVRREPFEPRMLRLFNRGHLEEPRFVAMLLMIGCEFWQHDDQGEQFRIEFADGHGGGSGDGVGRGIPDLPPTTAFCAEFKTHGEKSFIKLAGKLEDWRAYRKNPTRLQFPGEGVRIAKFEHFVQMQLYMHKMGLAAALYCAVNKNTDDVYMELVHLDSVFAEQFIGRGEQLVRLDTPPKRINESPGFWKCRFCGKRPVCHLGEAPELNCRTCLHVEVGPAGTWRCTLHGATLDKGRQAVGCTDYAVNPSL